MPAEAVKLVVKTIIRPILDALNGLYMEGSFPEHWKTGKLILIPKSKGRLSQTSDKAICLTNIMGKLYEELINMRLINELQGKNLLSESQYDFRKSRSTMGAFRKILHISRGANRQQPRKWYLSMLLDVKNAFKTAKIVESLESKNISYEVTNVVKDYLSDRKLIDGNSCSRRVGIGAPQGSILGPTLWNVMYDALFDAEVPAEIRLDGFCRRYRSRGNGHTHGRPEK